MATVAAACVALAACSDDDAVTIVAPPEPPPPPRDAPTFFSLTASFGASTPAPEEQIGWRIYAMLDPGMEDSVPRTATDTLWVDGAPVLPFRVQDRVRMYAVQIDQSPATAHERTIQVRPPRVEALSATDIYIIGAGRTGGDTIAWAPGSDLILPVLAPLTSPEPAPMRGSWNAVLLTQERRLAMSGTDLPTDGIRIPAPYVSVADSLPRVYFGFDQSRYSDRLDAASYHVMYGIRTNYFWWITENGS
jgi:hypothetical protein